MQLAEQSRPDTAHQSGHNDVGDSPKLILADGCRLNAESIAWCLSAYGSFRDVESVTSAAELLNIIRTQRPALVLIGERIIAEGIREIFTELAVRMGETRIAVFVDDLTDRQLDLLVNNRVTATLSRKDSMRNLNEQLLRVAVGEAVLSPLLNDRITLSKNGDFRCVASGHLKKLTDRQWDVLLRIAEGRRVSEVADDLDLSPKAVESHKYRIMKTLGASDRVDLCRWAIREGLIEA